MPANRPTADHRWSLQLAVTIWTGLLLGGWLLAARAAAGALTRPLEPGLAWTATVSMAVLGLLAAVLHRHAQPVRRPSTTPLVATLTLAPTLLTGCVLLDLSELAPRIGLPGIAVATTLALVRTRRTQRRLDPVACPSAATPAPPPIRPTPDLSQTLRRHRDPSGDRLDGDLVMHWQSGQRQQPVHVPFVPAFEDKPEVSCSCEDDEPGQSVRARVAEVQRFGTRIELKRTGNVDATQTTRLQLSVTLDDSDRRAA